MYHSLSITVDKASYRGSRTESASTLEDYDNAGDSFNPLASLFDPQEISQEDQENE